MEQFAKDFKESFIRRETGRGQRPTESESGDPADANDFLIAKLAPLCPACVLAPSMKSGDADETVFIAQLGLFNFAIKSNMSYTSMERLQLWCGRLTLSGTREVAMVKVTDLQAHMKANSSMGLDVKTFFRDLRAEGIKKAGPND